MSSPPHVTAQQSQWFRSVQAGLEADSGRDLAQWIEIAKTCPYEKHKARLRWFKAEHGLGMNRASLVLSAAFETGLGWSDPDNLLAFLWKTPETRVIYDAVAALAKNLGVDVVIGPRKNFSAFSRRYQFAALRPTRNGVRLGVAVPLADVAGAVAPVSSDSWSDRLTAVVVLGVVADVEHGIKSLLQEAYARSG